MPLKPPLDRPRSSTEDASALSQDDVARLTALGMTTLEIAHDLGNLLQIAGSAIRLIDRQLECAPQPELRALIQAAHTSIEKATKLGRQILDTGQPQRTGRDVVQIGAMLADMACAIALTAGDGVQLCVECERDLPDVACEKADLENAILNLVANARNAMDGCGRLTLSVRSVSLLNQGQAGRKGVMMSVADNGCGMSEPVAAKALTPFFTTKANARGTGLGLAMVADFMDRVGGSIEILTRPGEGATVNLRLPSCEG